MSSAIKMLKEIKKDYELDLAFRKQVQENISKERIIALDEALLALEQKEDDRKQGAIEQKEKDKIDFIRLEVMPKSKKKQYRVFFKDGTEQVFELEGVKQNEL